jgi:hypothetical protein
VEIQFPLLFGVWQCGIMDTWGFLLRNFIRLMALVFWGLNGGSKGGFGGGFYSFTRVHSGGFSGGIIIGRVALSGLTGDHSGALKGGIYTKVFLSSVGSLSTSHSFFPTMQLSSIGRRQAMLISK